MIHLASAASAVSKYPDGLALLVALAFLGVGLVSKTRALIAIGLIGVAGLCVYAFSSGFFSGLH